MDSDAGLAEALSGLAEAVGAGSTDDERFGGDENAAPDDDDAAHAALLARFQDAYAALEDDEDRPLVVDKQPAARGGGGGARIATPGRGGGARARAATEQQPQDLGGGGGDGGGAAGGAPRPKPLRKRRSSAEEAAADGFGAPVRCACRVGEEVWCAERDGSIAVRDAHTAALRAKIMVSLHDVTIGAMAAQDGLVWCGTQTGPLLLFDATTRALRGSCARTAAACTPSRRPTAGAGPTTLWSRAAPTSSCCAGAAEPHKLRKAYSGHGGAVRSALVLGMQRGAAPTTRTVRVGTPQPASLG